MPINKGLEGVVVSGTALSQVYGEEGRLIYHGYDIADLANNTSFEEVTHLLWYGHLPNKSELATLQSQLAAQRALSETALSVLRALPQTSEPMDLLRTVASAEGIVRQIDGKPTIEQAVSLTAFFPTILTAFDRLRHGLQPIAPRADLSHAANYLYMLNGQVPDNNRTKALDTYLILTADHGMNASTFTARVVASTMSDMCSSVVAAIGALKGPLHGGAADAAFAMLQKIGTPENAEKWLTNALDHGERLMGFGHRVYKAEDPRARILRHMAANMPDIAYFNLAVRVEDLALEMLHARKPENRLYTNVDFYSAAVFHAVGLPEDLFTPTFAVSRVAGWTAHVLEQMIDNRLIRPASDYTGPLGLTTVPINQRP